MPLANSGSRLRLAVVENHTSLPRYSICENRHSSGILSCLTLSINGALSFKSSVTFWNLTSSTSEDFWDKPVGSQSRGSWIEFVLSHPCWILTLR